MTEINSKVKLDPIIASTKNANHHINNTKSNNTGVINISLNKNKIEQIDLDRNVVDKYKIDNKDILDFITKATATHIVTNAKFVAGMYDVIEHIGDGIFWTGGKVVEGTTYAVAQIAGLVSEDAKKSVLNWREQEKAFVKDNIAVNVVDNIENSIFNSTIGSAINEASHLKYDSKAANKIEDITKVGAEIAGATAATIATGGTASPTLVAVVGGLGFAEGTGEKAQNIYKENKNITGANEGAILFSGLEGATKWYAYGRLGSGAISATEQIRNIATHGEWTTRFGTSNTLSGALKTLFQNRRRRNVREYLGKSVVGALTNFEDVVDMSGGIFGTISNSLDTKDTSAVKTGATVASGVVKNVIINTSLNKLDFFGDSLRTPAFVDSLDNRIISLTKTLFKTIDAAQDSN